MRCHFACLPSRTFNWNIPKPDILQRGRPNCPPLPRAYTKSTLFSKPSPSKCTAQRNKIMMGIARAIFMFTRSGQLGVQWNMTSGNKNNVTSTQDAFPFKKYLLTHKIPYYKNVHIAACKVSDSALPPPSSV